MVRALLVCGAFGLLACGGKSSGHPSGSSAGGSSPAPAERRGCEYSGQHYADGDSVPSPDGCNSCSCDDGIVGCTLLPCDPGPGPAQPAVSCEQVEVFYEQLLDENKNCDPHEPDPCSFRMSSALGCGCDTFLNPQHLDIALAQAFATHHEGLGCGDGVACGSCTAPPLRGKCTPMGRCVDTAEPGPGPGCKVGGVFYADGAGRIPDPVSCNECTCNAGQLNCTEKNCPKPCPPGTVLATSCAQCGPTDACQVVEHACYPACMDTCAEGSCIGGACVPGICG